MSTREAELFDGTVLEFPANTPDDVIMRTVKQQTLAAKIRAAKPIVDAQAAKYPSPGKQGVDTTLGSFLPELLGDTSKNLAPNDPNAEGILGPLLSIPGKVVGAGKQLLDRATMPSLAQNLLTAGEFVAPYNEQYQKGNYSGLAGKVAALPAAALISKGVSAGVGGGLNAAANSGLPEALMQSGPILRDAGAKVMPKTFSNNILSQPIQAGRYAIGGGLKAAAPLAEKVAIALAKRQKSPSGPGLTGALPERVAYGLEGSEIMPERAPMAAGEAAKMTTPAEPVIGTGGAPSWAPETPPIDQPRPGRFLESGNPLRDQFDREAFTRQIQQDDLRNPANQTRPPQNPTDAPLPPWEDQGPLGIPRPEAPPIPQPMQAAVPLSERLMNAERAASPSGMKARRAIQMVDEKGQPTALGQKVLEVAPELTETQPGPLWDTQAFSRFKQMEQSLDAAKKAVPPSTVVPTGEILGAWRKQLQKYLSPSGDVQYATAARSLSEFIDAIEAFGSEMKWNDFRLMKEKFMDGMRASPWLRESYGPLIEASNKAVPELAPFNTNYSALRTIMDNSGIDVKTGRRLSTVGKQP